MGLIINPRGTNGAGKTELVRRILADFRHEGTTSTPIMVAGRARPIGERLIHPRGGASLAVLGLYERTSGGTDTVSLKDGGLDAVFRLAGSHAAAGDAVLLEGSTLSEDHVRTASLAARHPVHVVWVDTPLEDCVRNLIARRRVGRAEWDTIAAAVRTRRAAVAAACDALRLSAAVMHVLSFDTAIIFVRKCLALENSELCPEPSWGEPPQARDL